jgi:hypothetical protein
MMYVSANEKAVSLNLHRYNVELMRSRVVSVESVIEAGRRTLCILLAPPPPRMIG